VVPALLWFGIAVNVAALVAFKHSHSFLLPVSPSLGVMASELPTSVMGLLLPIGLSYRVLENISYLTEVYRGQTPPSQDPADFFLYTFYFPKLLSGPIERTRTFMPQLTGQRIVDNEVLARSLALISVGAIRKMVIADTIASVIPPAAFETPLKYSAFELCTWLIGSAFVFYNDFAGYTDIVRGVSGLFGIELSRNFSTPFFSRSFVELWTRWHMTLSLWLRDYVYLPFSRALLRRNPNPRTILNLAIPPVAAMLVSGLWHGGSLHMMVWGGLIGSYLVIERILALRRPVVHPDTQPFWKQIAKMMTVFSLIVLSVIPFRMDLHIAWQFLCGLSRLNKGATPDLHLFLMIGVSLCIDYVQYRNRDEVAFLSWPPLVRATLLAAAILAVFLATRMRPVTPFIYQAF
jgi:D-alanyl-lipoteichoic acid acyltransferase DltB (MBOAT superfamily)